VACATVLGGAGATGERREVLASVSPERAAHRVPAVTRRTLQRVLAFLWLLDGVLQLQPFMFTSGFADRVIAPTAGGQPGFVAAVVHWSASLVLANRIGGDALFAAVQLAIGAALLFRRTARPAILMSVAWALGVWVFGEGLGGLAGGTSTLLTGAPGAVILYAVIGLAAWPRLGAEGRSVLVSKSAGLGARVGALFARVDDERPARWVPGAWAALWGLFALLQALPVNDSASALANQLQASTSSAPTWLAHADRTLAASAGHAGPWPIVALIALEVTIALLGLRQGTPRRLAATAGIAVALAAWVLGQAFGQIATGMGTDPNAGPLIALLGIALLGRVEPSSASSGALRGAESAPRGRPRLEAA
jgi:hypothetical protein